MGEKAWYAATNEGLFISVDQGQKWYGQPVEGESNFSAVNSYEDGTVTLAGPKGAYISRDDGKTWTAMVLPQYVSGCLQLDDDARFVAVAGNPRRVRCAPPTAVRAGITCSKWTSQERRAGGAL